MNLHTQSTFVHQFPESDATGSITKDTESSNGTAEQGQGQPVKPIGSAAARFQIRSAKTIQHRPEPTTKDFWKMYNVFEGGKAESTCRKSDPSKNVLHKGYTSSTSCKHTDIDYTETPKTVGIQEDKSQTGSERSSEALRRCYKSNRSKSLDWREVSSKTGPGNRTGIISGNRDHKFIRRADSLEGQGANNKISSQTEEYQSNSISWSIKSYNAASQCDQNSDKKAYPISGQTPVRMSQVTLERASSGQSLPARLKPRHSQGYNGGGSNPWAQLQQDESSLDQTCNRKRSWAREQGLTNTEEVTGNQTIMERIKNLFGASLTDDKFDANPKDSIRLKRNSTPNSDRSFPFSDAMDSIPSCRKSTTESQSGTPSPSSDIQQSRLLYSVDKAGTFPRQFSKNEKAFFGKMQGPSTNLENENDKKDASSGLNVPVSSKPKWSMERTFEKKNLFILPADNEEMSRMWCAGSPEFCSRSLERTRSRLSATAQSRGCKIQSTTYEGSPTSFSGQVVNNLVTTSEDQHSDKETTKASTKTLDLSERKYLGLQVTSDKDQITQPKSPLASKGLAKSEIHEEEVFTVKTEGRKLDGVLEESCVPTLDSVKNRINMFEALAQQSKSKHQILLARRALSVPELPKPVALVKKSDSDKNLHYSRVVGNREFLRTNLIIKSDASVETKDLNRTPRSVSTVKVRPTLEQSRETKESVESPLKLKQLNEPKTDQDVSPWDKNVDCGQRRTVQNRHIDEPDFAIPTRFGLRKIETMEGKARNPITQSTITQKSNAKISLIKQQSINVEMDDDNDYTLTSSPDKAPLTINIQRQSYPATSEQSEEHQTSGCSDVGVYTPVKSAVLTVNGTHETVLPSPSHNSISTIPVQTISLNNSNNNNYETTRKYSNIFSASMARLNSDEEDDDDEDDEETETENDSDSDSGESSVTITSNMSQSDRRSFSLSLVDLCNFGGVDYKPSYGIVSEDEEDRLSTRSASLSSDISAFSSVTLLSTDELNHLLDDVMSLGDDTLQKYEDVQVVVLHKEVGSGLGFTLAGGVDQNKPVTVHRVIPGGVAAQEGSIFEGDRVLSINGTALQNSSHWEALRTLRKARGQGMTVVVLKRGDLSESQHSKKEARQRPGNTESHTNLGWNEGRRIHVTLNKSRYDLGFSLEGGVDSSSGDKPLTVQKIFQDGPVSEVFPGDELLEVKDQSLVGMRRLEAWNLIKKLPPGPVEVLINRPHQPH